jgi:hypothetical protein
VDRRSRRVFWALNHKTLLRAEVPLLLALGYEVFMPKSVPSENYRSGAVSFEFDQSLSIPQEDLEILNRCDFFAEAWSAEIVELVNKYFGICITLTHLPISFQALVRFDGALVLRAYGLPDDETYDTLIPRLNTSVMKDLIRLSGDDVYFGVGYENLALAEPEYLSERALYLPIAAPDDLWLHENTHTGVGGYVLFLCGNRLTSAHAAQQFAEFLDVVGDRPYIVVDSQDDAAGDPNVRYRPSDDELLTLYQQAAAFYTPATTARHALYSPIEAAIIGVPLIFHEQSLLGSLTPQVTLGKVRTSDQAREVLSQVLDGNSLFARELVANQKSLAAVFRYDTCLEVWRENFPQIASVDVRSTNSAPSRLRALRNRLTRGRAREREPRLAQRWGTWQAMAQRVQALYPDVPLFEDRTLTISMSEDFPWFVGSMHNLGGAEHFGRWTLNSVSFVQLLAAVPRRIRVTITVHAWNSNIGLPIRMSVGKETVQFVIPDNAVHTFSFLVTPGKDARRMSWQIPNPQMPPNDSRRVGIAIHRVVIEDLS